MISEEIRQLLDNAETVDITTIGRYSGRSSRIEIWMHTIDRRYIVTGTPGPRDWYANVLANPSMTLHLPNGIDLPAVAIPVLDQGFRRKVFTAERTWWYRSQADLEELIATSPMIEMRF